MKKLFFTGIVLFAMIGGYSVYGNAYQGSVGHHSYTQALSDTTPKNKRDTSRHKNQNWAKDSTLRKDTILPRDTSKH